MSRKKRLNIHNTDKVFNLTVIEQYDQDDEVVVTLENIQAVNQEIQDHLDSQGKLKTRDDTHYIVRYAENFTIEALERIIRYGGAFTLETKQGLGMEYLPLLADNRKNGRVSFLLRPGYTFEQVQEIVSFSEVLTVSLMVTIRLGQPSSGTIIKALSQLRYRVDKVELSFPTVTKEEYLTLDNPEEYYELVGGLYLPKPEHKYKAFSELRNACSFWKMNLLMRAHSKEEHARLIALAEVDKAVRKGNLTW